MNGWENAHSASDIRFRAKIAAAQKAILNHAKPIMGIPFVNTAWVLRNPQLALLIPCSRHKSATGTPFSACFKMLRICASLYFDFFIRISSFVR